MERLTADAFGLARAAELLRAGELVAFPTETVYGLGADAANPDAVRRIFAAKGRPADHPLIVHLPEPAAMADWAATVPESALRLADAFWPGPLTLIVDKASSVDDAVTGGQDTVGLRVPNHPVARALLHAFGAALAAPSANRFGHVSPTTAAHVLAEFEGDEVAAVIDGGACPVGVESTIVDLSGPSPRMLRPGMIRHEALEAVLDAPVPNAAGSEGPRASGRLASHYAPGAPVLLVEAGRMAAALSEVPGGSRVAVLGRGDRIERPGIVEWIEMPRQPVQYARRLYAALRQADAAGPDRILIERPPAGDGWAAIADRLQRAASGDAAAGAARR